MSYEGPLYTQTPNLFFDEHLAEMSECECKVVLAIIRQTCGWHRDSKRLSIQDLEKMTGLSNRGVIDGTQAALERGVIVRRESGQGYEYRLAVGGEKSSQGGVSNSQGSGEKSSQEGGEKSSQEGMRNSHPNKRKGKKGNSKKEGKERDDDHDRTHAGDGPDFGKPESGVDNAPLDEDEPWIGHGNDLYVPEANRLMEKYPPDAVDQLVRNQWGGKKNWSFSTIAKLAREHPFRRFVLGVVVTANEGPPSPAFLNGVLKNFSKGPQEETSTAESSSGGSLGDYV